MVLSGNGAWIINPHPLHPALISLCSGIQLTLISWEYSHHTCRITDELQRQGDNTVLEPNKRNTQIALSLWELFSISRLNELYKILFTRFHSTKYIYIYLTCLLKNKKRNFKEKKCVPTYSM